MDRIITVIIFVLITTLTQNAQTTFEKSYGGSNEDVGYSVTQTDDGGYIVVGWTKSFSSDSVDIYLIKLDANGNETWSKVFGGAGEEVILSVAQTSDGGYILTGRTNSFTAGVSELYLVNTDVNGDTLWTKTFGGGIGRSVFQTSDGGYIIAGETNMSGAQFIDAYLIKTNVNGNQEWSKTFHRFINDYAYSVQQTADGGYVLAGYTQSISGDFDVLLVKTTSGGDTSWVKIYGGTGFDFGVSVDQTSDGGYIIVGNTNSFGAGAEDVYLIKTDTDGNSLWTKTFGGADTDVGYSVRQTTDGGYIIAGVTGNAATMNYDAYLIKTDADGNESWSRTFGGTGNEQSYSVKQTNDGGYVLSGQTSSIGSGDADVYVIKTDNSGLTDVHIEHTLIPESFTIKQNYPNPFNPSTKIQFSVPTSAFVSLKVYDVLGKEVTTLVNEELNAGTYNYNFDASLLTSGVYFYRVQSGGFVETKKMVLLK